MVVQTRRRDGRFIGIQIGAENVRRFFPPAHSIIELLLGHLHIYCKLEPEFWKGQPHIDDPRLADWLEAQCHRNRKPGSSVSLVMTSAGQDCFRIEIVRAAPQPETPAKQRQEAHPVLPPG